MPTLGALTIVLLASLAGCRTAGGGECDTGEPSVTVVTLNLYHDRDEWPKRRALIVDELRKAKPGLIALQEVLQAPGLRNQAEDLAEALGHRYVFVSQDAQHLPRRYGNAILSRHPIVRHDEVRLEPRDDYRSAGRVRVVVHGRMLDFVATHLHSGETGGKIRARQVRHLLEFAGAVEGQSAGTIVAGDFNGTAGSEELGPMHRAFVDAYARLHPDADFRPASHATLNPAYFERSTRIDHVYAQRGRFKTCEARRILDTPDASGRWPSDHFGVLVRLAFDDVAAEESSP